MVRIVSLTFPATFFTDISMMILLPNFHIVQGVLYTYQHFSHLKLYSFSFHKWQRDCSLLEKLTVKKKLIVKMGKII